jgi:hypothetical protein
MGVLGHRLIMGPAGGEVQALTRESTE